MNQARTIWRKLGICLYRRGIRHSLLRDVLRLQLALCLAALAGGLVLWPVAAWIFWIGAGAALSVWNFFSLTKLAPQFMVGKYTSSIGIAFFLRSQGRLVGTVVLIVLGIVWADAPAWALLAGFSVSLVSIVAAALRRGKKTAPSTQP